MTFTEFELVIDNMRSKWGKSKFDKTKCELIYRVVQHLSLSAFKNIVEGFIGEDIPAKVSEFRDAVLNHSKVNGYASRPDGCCFCADGWIMAESKTDKAVFGFKCECDAGRYLSKYIPFWNEIRLNEEYIKIPAS